MESINITESGNKVLQRDSHLVLEERQQSYL